MSKIQTSSINPIIESSPKIYGSTPNTLANILFWILLIIIIGGILISLLLYFHIHNKLIDAISDAYLNRIKNIENLLTDKNNKCKGKLINKNGKALCKGLSDCENNYIKGSSIQEKFVGLDPDKYYQCKKTNTNNCAYFLAGKDISSSECTIDS